MSDPKDLPAVENSFSTFMFGLTLGIVGTILLGTEEGRKVSRKLLQSAGETLEKNEDLFQEAKNVASQAVHEIENQFRQPQSYLPDQPTTRYEPPPPPPPYTNRPRPNPTYFESNGNPLEP